MGNGKRIGINHPFGGTTANGKFALCHNGVLHNDSYLQTINDLPHTQIQTDSYVAVQLLEKYGNLNFETIAKMSEAVSGSFVFTMLNDDNTLYISKGDNPICLIHFKELGLYVYASTTSIMKEALEDSFLTQETVEVIDVGEGDIICIDKNGKLERDYFNFDGYEFGEYKMFSPYHFDMNDYDYLNEMACIFGISADDLILLYEMGYSDEEIEIICGDSEYLKECLADAKMFMGEYA